MSSLPASAAAAVALFAGTNVDDLVVLALLSAASRAAGRPRRWEIWAGQYLGFAALVGLSLAAGRGLSLLPSRWLWLLALIPLAIGLIMLAGAVRETRRGPQPEDAAEDDRPALPRLPSLPGLAGLPAAAGVAGVALLTVVDGSDDVAAYTPVFATAGGDRIAVTLVVFAGCVAVWCGAGALLTRHQRITDTLRDYGRWILPVGFILIGLYTLSVTNGPIHV